MLNDDMKLRDEYRAFLNEVKKYIWKLWVSEDECQVVGPFSESSVCEISASHVKHFQFYPPQKIIKVKKQREKVEQPEKPPKKQRDPFVNPLTRNDDSKISEKNKPLPSIEE